MRAGVQTTVRDELPASSRYEVLVKIATGGMATVYIGCLSGVVGFRRLVAIKRAHPHLVDDAAFRRMLVEEARVASKIHHPNVVAVQDVEDLEGELLLIMNYVEGAPLSALLAHHAPLPPQAVVRVVLDAAAGLAAAHDLTDETGRKMCLVHRDVSPQNILVGIDGIARLADFGIAKDAHAASGATATGALKGKVGYMAPEYVAKGTVDTRSDLFALGVVLWEGLTRRRLFRAGSEIETLQAVLNTEAPAPSAVSSIVPAALDDVVLKALAKSPADRFASAQAFADALERAAQSCQLVASHPEVAEAVRTRVGETLDTRRALVRARLDQTSSNVDAFAAEDPIVLERSDLRTVTMRPAASARPSPSSPPSLLRRWGAIGSLVSISALAAVMTWGRSPASEIPRAPATSAPEKENLNTAQVVAISASSQAASSSSSAPPERSSSSIASAAPIARRSPPAFSSPPPPATSSSMGAVDDRAPPNPYGNE